MVRWIARTLGLLYFAFVSWFVVAHAVEGKLPNLWQESLAVQFECLALFLVAVGGLVGWKWEGVAALMILGGSALWLIVERNLPWPPGLSLLIGLLYVLTWWNTRQHCTPQIVTKN
jgi:hypothetical protein